MKPPLYLQTKLRDCFRVPRGYSELTIPEWILLFIFALFYSGAVYNLYYFLKLTR